MRAVSRALSLGGVPATAANDASRVAHAAGIVGSGGRFGSPAPHTPVPPPLAPDAPPAPVPALASPPAPDAPPLPVAALPPCPAPLEPSGVPLPQPATPMMLRLASATSRQQRME